MSEKNILSIAERFQELTIYIRLVVQRTSGNHPETYRIYTEYTYDVLRKNGASEHSLKELEAYLKKVGADVLPLNNLKFSKLAWKIMTDLTLDYYKRNGEKK